MRTDHGGETGVGDVGALPCGDEHERSTLHGKRPVEKGTVPGEWVRLGEDPVTAEVIVDETQATDSDKHRSYRKAG
jgi:hypothetical protein